MELLLLNSQRKRLLNVFYHGEIINASGHIFLYFKYYKISMFIEIVVVLLSLHTVLHFNAYIKKHL